MKNINNYSIQVTALRRYPPLLAQSYYTLLIFNRFGPIVIKVQKTIYWVHPYEEVTAYVFIITKHWFLGSKLSSKIDNRQNTIFK